MPVKERILIASNRLPVSLCQDPSGGISFTRSAGGLVSGLRHLHAGGDSLWIGHSGVTVDDPRFQAARDSLGGSRFIAVPLKGGDYDAFYSGMANGVLWPLFHYFPTIMRQEPGHWAAYQAVNRAFADEIIRIARPGDRVWVHDYQLMLLPAMLREARPRLPVAYFHHIPFPSSEMFRILPVRREILQGLLGADLIGFHTLDYVRHFLTCVSRILGGEVERDEIRYHHRRVRAGAFPLGIDVGSLRRKVMEPAAVPGMTELAQSLAGKKVLLGIDRLDYTKGIPQRLAAYKLLLEENPRYIGKVAFVQVCVPSRESTPDYGELRAEVERLVGQINGEHGRPGYVPLQYLYQPFSPDQVTAFYRLGDVAVVTPLRDGLNLVCKEFVTSRDDEDGVLILSEFAGAAAEMGEALIVNPHDVAQLAQTLRDALEMPFIERNRRMQRLRRRVMGYNNIRWADDFLDGWKGVSAASGSQPRHLSGRAKAGLLRKISGIRNKRLFLDYDGTLTPIRLRPDLALPAPHMKELLGTLGRRADTEVVIVTGRPREFCDRHFSGLGVHLAAEHCAFFKDSGSDAWQASFGDQGLDEVKAIVLPHLQSFVDRIPGSLLEAKESAIVLHYRESEPVFAKAQALELRESVNQLLAHTAYTAVRAKKAIEIKPASASKAAAVRRYLEEWGGPDECFLTAGDDWGDEEMFRLKSDSNLSIQCGGGATSAKYIVSGVDDLLEFLGVVSKLPISGRPQDKEPRRHAEGAG